MLTAILNIGLARSTHESVPRQPSGLAVGNVLDVLIAAQLNPTAWRVADSATEATLIVRVQMNDDDWFNTTTEALQDALQDVCRLLDQDAIAGTVKGVGFLTGPRAEAWGEFNPAFFLPLFAGDKA